MPSKRVTCFTLTALFCIARPSSAADQTAEIRRLSQEFSDASATGDAKVFTRLLDDRVVFIDENGNVSTKKDIVGNAGAVATPPGVSHTLVQRNFAVAFHGNVAVTSFTDSSTLSFHGQALLSDYLSTEVWLDEADGWKMISSQTLAVPNDPPAVELRANDLDEYVGTYTGGPGYSIALAHTGSELTASTNGGQPVVLKAELKDVLFVPGQPRLRRIFQRDPEGKITGFVSRREGHDLVFRRVT